jgi:hypothetical protein
MPVAGITSSTSRHVDGTTTPISPWVRRQIARKPQDLFINLSVVRNGIAPGLPCPSVKCDDCEFCEENSVELDVI